MALPPIVPRVTKLTISQRYYLLWQIDMLNSLNIPPPRSLGLTLISLIPALLVFARAMKFFGFNSLPTRQRTIPLKDERIVIFGASSGIGRSIALEYARRGARICIIARRRPELETLKEEITSLSASSAKETAWHEPLIVIADATKPEDVLRVREEVNTSM